MYIQYTVKKKLFSSLAPHSFFWLEHFLIVITFSLILKQEMLNKFCRETKNNNQLKQTFPTRTDKALMVPL